MGIFSKKVVPVFGSRSEAFDYMLSELVAKGRDMMDAAEQAGRFAEIVATNKRLPDVPAKERNMLEKGIDYAKQIAALKQENPEVWEIATSAIGGVIGAVGGGGVSIEEPVKAAIDFNSLE